MDKPGSFLSLSLSRALGGKQAPASVQDCTYTKGFITLKPDEAGLKSLAWWDRCECSKRHLGALVHGDFRYPSDSNSNAACCGNPQLPPPGDFQGQPPHIGLYARGSWLPQAG